MKTRYPCLILDHDDTAVNSTPEVNYPAFLDTMAKLRPGLSYTLGDFVALCSDPGFYPYFTGILKFTPEEMDFELRNWRRFSDARIPTAFPGIGRIIARQRAAGGCVCVATHSYADTVLRDWKAAFDRVPDAVWAWDGPAEHRKPSPFPVRDACARFGLSPGQILVVDDARPGLEMARAAGASFAAACWGAVPPAVRQDLRADADFFLENVSELEDLLFYE